MEEHPLMMRCTQCGEMNRLPVVHCKKCGSKLDFDAAEMEVRNSGGKTFAEHMGSGIKMGVALAVVLMILLTIWPGQMSRSTGAEIDAKRYRMKSELLVDALNRGMPASQVITEDEMNAHLRELVAAQSPRKGKGARLEDIGVRFSDGRAEAFVAVGRGPFTLTARFVAKPKDSDLVVVGATAGHLPLPSFLGRIYAGTQSGLLRQMKNEFRILRNLDGASVKDGSIEVLVKLGK